VFSINNFWYIVSYAEKLIYSDSSYYAASEKLLQTLQHFMVVEIRCENPLKSRFFHLFKVFSSNNFWYIESYAEKLIFPESSYYAASDKLL